MDQSFYIAGVQFRSKEDISQALKVLKVGDILILDLEPTNHFDPNAVRVLKDDLFLGYVPKKYSSEVAGMLSIGTSIQCTLDQLNPDAKTYEMFKVTINIPEVL